MSGGLPAREEQIIILEAALEERAVSYPVLDDHGKPDTGLTATWILDNHRVATFEETDEILIYNPSLGVYRPGEPFLKALVEDIFKGGVGTRFKAEVLDHIRHRTYRPMRRFNAEQGIVVANGVLDPLTGELSDFDPERHDTVRLPVAWDSEAECPAFTKALLEWVSREDARVLQEAVGYCLLRDVPFAVAIMLVGEGANGKSTFLQVLTALLARENISGETLQTLGQRFATANLWGKFANIAADLPAWPIKDAGAFKALTGGDLIRAERKFKAAFTFRNYAKLWFSANRVPRTEDESEAFYRRWKIVAFPRTFQGDEANPHLVDGLTAPEELSGILAWAVQGLRRLTGQGGFSGSSTVQEVRERYTRLSDPVAAFVEDRCVKDPNGRVPKDDLYEAYIGYCEDRGLTRLVKTVFPKELSRVAPWITASKIRTGGGRVWVWEGILLEEPVQAVQVVQADLHRKLSRFDHRG